MQGAWICFRGSEYSTRQKIEPQLAFGLEFLVEEQTNMRKTPGVCKHIHSTCRKMSERVFWLVGKAGKGILTVGIVNAPLHLNGIGAGQRGDWLVAIGDVMHSRSGSDGI